jgi:hypothetical protein
MEVIKCCNKEQKSLAIRIFFILNEEIHLYISLLKNTII